MPFNTSNLPEWNKTATKPAQSKLDNGWAASEKPAPSIWNWFFNKCYLAIKDLFDNAVHKESTSLVNYGGMTGGTANAYTVTLNPAPASLVDGLGVTVKIHAATTGPCTLNVNGLGAKPLKKANGNDAILKLNGTYTFRYNTTTANFILQGEGGAGDAATTDVLSGKTFSNDSGDQIGTMVNRGGVVLTPGTGNITIPQGYHDGSGYVATDADLVGGNIKKDVNIFGVVGTYDAKRYAKGVINQAANDAIIRVNGLPFKPKYIHVYDNNGWFFIYNYDQSTNTYYLRQLDGWVTITGASDSVINNDGFALSRGYNQASVVVTNWIAFE